LDVGAYLVLEDGVSYEIRAEYRVDGETIMRLLISFSRRQSLVK
jgi:hypothetical protein